MHYLIFLLTFCGVTVSQGWALERSLTAELGYQGASQTEKFKGTRSLLYLQPRVALTWESTEEDSQNKTTPFIVDFLGAARGELNTLSGLNGADRGELSVRALSLSASREKWKLSGGFQEIPWGETFGFPILDLVNPRDYRDPLFLDPAWVRLPVAALQGQVFLSRLTLQGVVTPISRSNRFLVPGSSYDLTVSPVKLQEQPVPGETQAEYGGKLNYLFENGLDLSLVYFRHQNRNLVYSLQGVPSVSGASYTLAPFLKTVDSWGGAFSYSLDAWVFRLDSVFHLDQPLQGDTLGKTEIGKQFQGVWGADTSSDSGWTLGFQWQMEYDIFDSSTAGASRDTQSKPRFLNWASTRVNKSFWDGKVEAAFFAFAGIGNSDIWFQPQVKWNASDLFSVMIRGDWITTSGRSNDGYLWIARDQSRILLWATLKI